MGRPKKNPLNGDILGHQALPKRVSLQYTPDFEKSLEILERYFSTSNKQYLITQSCIAFSKYLIKNNKVQQEA